MGLSSQSISTDDDRRFGVNSPGVGYGFHWLGEPVGVFAGVQFLLPLHARQDGEGVNVLSNYDNAYGLDLLLAATQSTDLAEDWSGFAGAGVHLNVVRLNDQVLRDFEHAATGAALVFGTRNGLDTQWLGGELGWSTRLDITADPIDLARGGNLAWAVAAHLMFALELAYQ